MSNWWVPSSLEEATKICKVAVDSSLFGDLKLSQAITLAISGAELGLGVLSSLRAFYILHGKQSMASKTCVALAMNSPDCEYFDMVESTESVATFKGKRIKGSEVVYSYSIKQANAAGLTRSTTWKKFPRQMLQARAAGGLAQALFADKLSGFSIEGVDKDEPIERKTKGGGSLPVRDVSTKPVPGNNDNPPVKPTVVDPVSASEPDVSGVSNIESNLRASIVKYNASGVAGVGKHCAQYIKSECVGLTVEDATTALKSAIKQLKEPGVALDTDLVITAAVLVLKEERE